jgi:hypothetical protein
MENSVADLQKSGNYMIVRYFSKFQVHKIDWAYYIHKQIKENPTDCEQHTTDV